MRRRVNQRLIQARAPQPDAVFPAPQMPNTIADRILERPDYGFGMVGGNRPTAMKKQTPGMPTPAAAPTPPTTPSTAGGGTQVGGGDTPPSLQQTPGLQLNSAGKLEAGGQGMTAAQSQQAYQTALASGDPNVLNAFLAAHPRIAAQHWASQIGYSGADPSQAYANLYNQFGNPYAPAPQPGPAQPAPNPAQPVTPPPAQPAPVAPPANPNYDPATGQIIGPADARYQWTDANGQAHVGAVVPPQMGGDPYLYDLWLQSGGNGMHQAEVAAAVQAQQLQPQQTAYQAQAMPQTQMPQPDQFLQPQPSQMMRPAQQQGVPQVLPQNPMGTGGAGFLPQGALGRSVGGPTQGMGAMGGPMPAQGIGVGQDFSQAPALGARGGVSPVTAKALYAAGVDDGSGATNNQPPPDLGLPLSPQFEAARRLLEDDLARTLGEIGVQRDQIGLLLNVTKQRLSTEQTRDQRSLKESLAERGIFDSSHLGTEMGTLNLGYDRRRQDLAFDASRQVSDLARAEAGAHNVYSNGLMELLLALANQQAQDPAAPVPVTPGPTSPGGGTGNGNGGAGSGSGSGGGGKGKGGGKNKGGGKGKGKGAGKGGGKGKPPGKGKVKVGGGKS